MRGKLIRYYIVRLWLLRPCVKKKRTFETKLSFKMNTRQEKWRRVRCKCSHHSFAFMPIATWLKRNFHDIIDMFAWFSFFSLTVLKTGTNITAWQKSHTQISPILERCFSSQTQQFLLHTEEGEMTLHFLLVNCNDSWFTIVWTQTQCFSVLGCGTLLVNPPNQQTLQLLFNFNGVIFRNRSERAVLQTSSTLQNSCL